MTLLYVACYMNEWMLDRCWIVGLFVYWIKIFLYIIWRGKIKTQNKIKEKKTLKCQPIKNCYLCLLNQTPSLGKIK